MNEAFRIIRPIIELDECEMDFAIAVGTRRQRQNIARGAGHGDGDDGWTRHIEGAGGEIAVAKFLGKFWSGNVGDMKADDVGGYQVRTTPRENYKLPIKAKDHDDKPFILVTGLMPKYRLVGWMYGFEGKRPEYWRGINDVPRPAYFVPQSMLGPMSTLPKLP